MESVKFYKSKSEQGVELTVNNTRAVGRVFYDYLTAINEETITYKYPLNDKEYERYLRQLEIIDSVLVTHDMKGPGESQYHLGSLLLMCIEFNNKYKDLIRDKERNARLTQSIAFIKLVKPLTALQKQGVKMSFEIER